MLPLTSAVTAQVDMDRLAAGLEKLQEEELLWVVQVVREMKTADTYTKTMLEGTSIRRLMHLPLSTSSTLVVTQHSLLPTRNSPERIRDWLTPGCTSIEGEFHVDLYTLPDNCLRRLWDYTAEKVDL